jgi:hypothetical protein
MILGLFRRELSLGLVSPLGVAMVAVWQFFAGALFMSELFAFEQAEQRALALDDPQLLALLDVNQLLLASMLNNMVVLLLFLGPLLALRHFSFGPADLWTLQRAKHPWHIAVVKAAAATLQVVALAALTLVFPVIIAVVGRAATGAGPAVDAAHAVLAIAVVAAAGATFVTVSGAVIAIVDQPLAGALMALVLLVLLWVLPAATAYLGPDLGALVAELSPAHHLEAALRGVVDVGDWVYFAGVNSAAVVVVIFAIDGRRR